MQQIAWLAVLAGAAILFFLPVIIGALRGTEPLWLVAILLPALWLGAWIALFVLPGRPAPARRGPERPYWDDPRHLYGGVPPAAPADVHRHRVGSRTRASSVRS